MVLQQASHRANQFSRSRSLRRYSLRDCAYSSMTFRRSSISDAARGCFAASLALSSGGFGFVIIQEGWGSRAALDLYQGADARFFGRLQRLHDVRNHRHRVGVRTSWNVGRSGKSADIASQACAPPSPWRIATVIRIGLWPLRSLSGSVQTAGQNLH
jgi:hypothetical protein